MIEILVVWNVLVCLLYGFDKFAAKRGMWRISEKTLLVTAFFMGGAGAYLGMEIFRHKTKHLKFRILVPLFFVINIVAVFLVMKFTAFEK